jgi:hypothetical protein
MVRRVVLVGLVTVLAILVPGCGGQEPSSVATPSDASPSLSGTASPSGEPSETTSPEPTATTSPTATPSAELEDGRHFGYIESIDPASGSMVWDLAYFLTGDEANEAAEAHGDEVPVPNDYYIVNDNPKLRTLTLAPAVELSVIDWGNCCDPVRGELQPFAEAFDTNQHAWDAMYQGAESQYWVTVDGGVVVAIEEQYLP